MPEKVPVDLQAMKHCLAEGYPFVFGLALFESFDMARRLGRVPLPSEEEWGRESHGGHAMLCVGYKDTAQVFIVRNSWGADWGDNGYCYIPYAYMTNPDFISDVWKVSGHADMDMDYSTGVWCHEDVDFPPEFYITTVEDMHNLRIFNLEEAVAADGHISEEERTKLVELLDKYDLDGSSLKRKIDQMAVMSDGTFEVLYNTVITSFRYMMRQRLRFKFRTNLPLPTGRSPKRKNCFGTGLQLILVRLY